MKKLTIQSFPDYFWSKVDRTADCWEWQGVLYPSGYGACAGRSVGYSQRAHRAAYEMTFGPFDKKLFVCHRCDNRKCVRPDHLFLGDSSDNQQDMMLKGRSLFGQRNGRAKLSVEDVWQIRLRLNSGDSINVIAADYGVSPGAIWFIRTGRNWARVT